MTAATNSLPNARARRPPSSQNPSSPSRNALIARAAAGSATVLLRGESCTGKQGADRAALEHALARSRGDRAPAARLLGVSRRTRN